MDKPTNCSIDGCTHEVNARGWCRFHYKRWHQTGTPHRLCKGCGNNLPENVRGYCSKACKPLCAVEGCGKPESAKGWCKTHYNRVAKWGTHERRPIQCMTCGHLYDAGHMGHNSKWCSEACKPHCSIDGCERPAQSHGWCTLHYRRHLTHGDPLRTDRPAWATEWVCVVCGDSVKKGSKRRKHCSTRCQQRDRRSRTTGIPYRSIRQCVRCGVDIDMSKGSAPNRKRRADVAFCESCKGRDRRPSRRQLEDLLYRDFLICGICDEPVDPDIAWPHRMSVTVDHIIPVAHGGSDDIENLQLAHLACNATKQDRVGFKIA